MVFDNRLLGSMLQGVKFFVFFWKGCFKTGCYLFGTIESRESENAKILLMLMNFIFQNKFDRWLRARFPLPQTQSSFFLLMWNARLKNIELLSDI